MTPENVCQIFVEGAGSRKKRLACAQEIKFFSLFSHYKFLPRYLSVSHTRASRFFRAGVSTHLRAAFGRELMFRTPFTLKPLFPRYLIGAYARGLAGG